MRADQADGLQRIVHRVGLGVVAITPQTISQDNRVDPVIEKVRNKVRALRSHIQSIVPATRRQNNSRPRVETAINRMHLNRRVVDVYDAVNPPGNRFAEVVLLSLAHAPRLQKR